MYVHVHLVKGIVHLYSFEFIYELAHIVTVANIKVNYIGFQ